MTDIGRLLACAALVGLSGCATITRGTTENFTVNSKPPGAQVKTSTGFSCQATPCTFKMQRKTAFTVTVSKDGFAPISRPIKSGMAAGGGAGFLGNALVGGVIGATVDVSSGAMNDLTPNPLSVVLVAAAPPPALAQAATPAAAAPVPAAVPAGPVVVPAVAPSAGTPSAAPTPPTLR